MKNVLQCVVICWAEVEGAIQWRTCYNTWWYAAIHGGMLGRSGGLVSMSTCKWKMMSFLFKTHKFAARWNCSNKFFGTKLMPGYLWRHVAFGKSAEKKHDKKAFRVVYKMGCVEDKIFAFTSFLHARKSLTGWKRLRSSSVVRRLCLDWHASLRLAGSNAPTSRPVSSALIE